VGALWRRFDGNNGPSKKNIVERKTSIFWLTTADMTSQVQCGCWLMGVLLLIGMGNGRSRAENLTWTDANAVATLAETGVATDQLGPTR
jgi:hypothetical protein